MSKILVIDDEEDIRQVFKDTLKLSGHDIDTAKNALEGLKKIKKGKYDIILLDINMPQMSGLELLEKIRQTDPKLKVIIISVVETKDAKAKANELGVEGYIVKPLSSNALNRAINFAMTERREEE